MRHKHTVKRRIARKERTWPAWGAGGGGVKMKEMNEGGSKERTNLGRTRISLYLYLLYKVYRAHITYICGKKRIGTTVNIQSCNDHFVVYIPS